MGQIRHKQRSCTILHPTSRSPSIVHPSNKYLAAQEDQRISLQLDLSNKTTCITANMVTTRRQSAINNGSPMVSTPTNGGYTNTTPSRRSPRKPAAKTWAETDGTGDRNSVWGLSGAAGKVVAWLGAAGLMVACPAFAIFMYDCGSFHTTLPSLQSNITHTGGTRSPSTKDHSRQASSKSYPVASPPPAPCGPPRLPEPGESSLALGC